MSSVRQLLIALLFALPFLCTDAMAKNVPGSAGVVSELTDPIAGAALADLAVDAGLGSVPTRRRTADGQEITEWGLTVPGEGDPNGNPMPSEWSISFRTRVLSLDGNPNGFKYDYTNIMGAFSLSRSLSESTSLVAGVIFEFSDADTHYNSGEVDGKGGGLTLGIVHALTPDTSFSLFGGGELLTYDISRSNGLFTGDYDATRFFIHALLNSQFGDDALWGRFRGGVRVIRQSNESYDEMSGGVPVNHVEGLDWLSVQTTSDLKIGTTFDAVRPYLQISGSYDFIDDNNLSAYGIDEQQFQGRIGAGFDASVMTGMLGLSGGARFSENGYNGFDVQIGFAKSF